jgi:hypothetical protein
VQKETEWADKLESKQEQVWHYIQHCAALYSIQHYTALYSTIQHCAALYTALFSTLLYPHRFDIHSYISTASTYRFGIPLRHTASTYRFDIPLLQVTFEKGMLRKCKAVMKEDEVPVY